MRERRDMVVTPDLLYAARGAEREEKRAAAFWQRVLPQAVARAAGRPRLVAALDERRLNR